MGFWAYHDARDIMQMLVMLLFATANQNTEKFCFFTTSYVSHATYEVLKLIFDLDTFMKWKYI